MKPAFHKKDVDAGAFVNAANGQASSPVPPPAPPADGWKFEKRTEPVKAVDEAAAFRRSSFPLNKFNVIIDGDAAAALVFSDRSLAGIQIPPDP